MLPLALIIVLGIARFSGHFQLISTREISAPGWGSWLSALLVLMFAYQGFEYAIMAGGEVDNPRRTVPFSLGVGMLVVMAIYTLLQFVTVATLGTTTSARPVAEAASVLIGPAGGILITVAVLVSTGGANSSLMLDAPRLLFSLAVEGEFPKIFAKLHPRFHTPTVSTIAFAALVWGLAVSGGFFWLLAVTAAASMIMYISICAALIQLRRRRPDADALRVPFGPVLAVIGIVMSLVLIAQLERGQLMLMGLTVLLGAVNWWVVRDRPAPARLEEREGPMAGA
jgi:amino acid transporter